MTYTITGANKQSGEEVKLTITAKSDADAIEQANAQGVLVAKIEKQSLVRQIVREKDEELEERWQAMRERAAGNPAADRLRFWAGIITIFSLGLLLPIAAIYKGMAELIDQNDQRLARLKSNPDL